MNERTDVDYRPLRSCTAYQPIGTRKIMSPSSSLHKFTCRPSKTMLTLLLCPSFLEVLFLLILLLFSTAITRLKKYMGLDVLRI